MLYCSALFARYANKIKTAIFASLLVAILIRTPDVFPSFENKYFLEPMTFAEIIKAKESAIQFYAQDLLKAGCCATEAEAFEAAREEIYQESSFKNYFFTIRSSAVEKPLGYVWCDRSNGEESDEELLSDAYVQTIFLEQEFRGKGIAEKIMRNLEKQFKKAGASSIGLFVFAHNESAYHLYEKLGYKIMKIVVHPDMVVIGFRMKKELSTEVLS